MTQRRPQSTRSNRSPKRNQVVVSRPGSAPEIQTIDTDEGTPAKLTMVQVFGADFDMTEMRTEQKYIGPPHLVQLIEQGIPVYSNSVIGIVCHSWHGIRMYCGPDYDTFERALDARAFVLVGLSDHDAALVMKSFDGDSPRLATSEP